MPPPVLEYPQHVKNKDLQFISSIEVLDNSNLAKNIKQFNAAKEALLKKINEELSNTQLIIEIYTFFKNNRALLIEIEKLSLQRKLISKKTVNDFKTCDRINNQSQELLIQAKNFSNWAESIIPQQSFAKIINSTSKDISEEPKEHTNKLEKDKATERDQKGVDLLPHLVMQKLDPKHHAWGTESNLQKTYDSWIKEHNKQEELIVEIELNANKKKSTSVYNKYFTPEEACAHLATTDHSKRLCLNKNLISTFQATDEMYLYIMDIKGNLFIHPKNLYIDSNDEIYTNNNDNNPDLMRIDHPAFTAGEAVACAGEVEIQAGKIKFINNNSSYYQTGPFTLHRVVNELNKRGILHKDCKITDCTNEFYLEVKGAKEFKLSYTEFDAQYKIKRESRNMIPLDLSEKPNPLKLLNCLADINRYLKLRANETSTFLTKLFDSYTGEDYYKRRNSFKSILGKLSDGNINAALTAIDKDIAIFQKNCFSSSYYANHLKNLKIILEEYKKPSFKLLKLDDAVKEKINSYYQLYDKMEKYTESVQTYHQKYSIFSNNDATRNKIISTKIDYKYQLESTPKNIKDEFFTDHEQHKIEYQNIKSFR